MELHFLCFPQKKYAAPFTDNYVSKFWIFKKQEIIAFLLLGVIFR